ncbi:MAG: hypothetical protein AVDCRST_MAG47-1338, partial [uncultured Nocardioidaceae bacterium]
AADLDGPRDGRRAPPARTGTARRSSSQGVPPSPTALAGGRCRGDRRRGGRGRARGASPGTPAGAVGRSLGRPACRGPLPCRATRTGPSAARRRLLRGAGGGAPCRTAGHPRGRALCRGVAGGRCRLRGCPARRVGAGGHAPTGSAAGCRTSAPTGRRLGDQCEHRLRLGPGRRAGAHDRPGRGGYRPSGAGGAGVGPGHRPAGDRAAGGRAARRPGDRSPPLALPPRHPRRRRLPRCGGRPQPGRPRLDRPDRGQLGRGERL